MGKCQRAKSKEQRAKSKKQKGRRDMNIHARCIDENMINIEILAGFHTLLIFCNIVSSVL